MTNHAIAELDQKGLRNFALTFGAMFVALFGLFFPWIMTSSFPLWPWFLWLFMAVWGVTAAKTLRPFYRAWMKFGLLMSKVTTPLILGIIYYVVITPTAVIARVFRSDQLHRDCKQPCDTFRVESAKKPRDHMENPF